jgi:hypothetical protein
MAAIDESLARFTVTSIAGTGSLPPRLSYVSSSLPDALVLTAAEKGSGASALAVVSEPNLQGEKAHAGAQANPQLLDSCSKQATLGQAGKPFGLVHFYYTRPATTSNVQHRSSASASHVHHPTLL